ncbi:magnesium chelatase subunit D [Sphingorhabdus sp.]|uniref:magnesium chelatase subunit D n=1 Tax=Sphingorhabdus sp. TaxID=1902408 RepID=UPI003593C52B
MSIDGAIDVDISDAELALHLFVQNPRKLGGIMLRGDGPVRDGMVAFAQDAIARHGPVKRIPVNIDSERLLGGLDLSATLAAGRAITRPGLLSDASGGAVIVPMAERTPSDIAAHIAQVMDGGNLAAILLDDSVQDEESPSPALTERIAFHCDISDLRSFDVNPGRWPITKSASNAAPLTDVQLTALANTAGALGISSVRPLVFAHRVALMHAMQNGRDAANGDDIAAAVRLVLAPRATRFPSEEPQPETEPETGENQPEDNTNDTDSRQIEDIDLDDIVLDAAVAAIPKHILDQIDKKAKGGGKGQAGRSGQKQKSALRGRPLGARPGMPGHGKKLSIIDTLRTAAPWQAIRRQAAHPGDTRTIHIRKSDLRVRHYEQRRESLTIFAVDASGSSALSRLAEAKGAVEMMLAQAYVKRSQVALIAFRQSGSEILLPPTRSLTRARRALAALPGGGGTPLAAGLIAAQQLAEVAQRAGQTPTIAILTDGKGNVAMDGTASRTKAMEEAHNAARNVAALGLNCIVIDISPRPREEAAELAVALNGRYLPLPQAQSTAMVAAIESMNAQ